MIGNDVIDLGDPDTQPGATHPRFDARVFTATELDAIQTSPVPNRVRWLLWAAKESAFKAFRKQDPSLVFSPARLVVRLEQAQGEGMGRGTVLCREETPVRQDGARGAVIYAAETEGAVHVIAQTDAEGEMAVLADAAQVDAECPSVAVRRLAIAALAPRLDVEPGELTIVRAGRVPRLWLRGRLAPVDLSLSHHGRFVAFAGMLDPRRSWARGAG
jgi:hypothetical protein